MPGELNLEEQERKRKLDKAMKAPIDEDRIRKAGW